MEKSTDKNGAEMTEADAKAFIARITPDMVQKSYSGKQGCMCGCNGKYSINPAHKKEADAERGYTMPAAKTLSSIKRVLRILQADPRTLVQDGYIIAVAYDQAEPGERNHVLYLCKSVRI